MQSTLGYALLALLQRAPHTAYELAAKLRRPVAYFWQARYSQIHPELLRLLAEGLVAVEEAPGPGPRDKKVYSLTAAGRRALREWLPEPPRAQPVRSELLLKAYAIWAADPLAARRLFEHESATHQARLAEYETQRATVQARHDYSPPPADHPDFGNYAALEYGIGYEKHCIAWCKWMTSRLAQTSSQPARKPTRRGVSDAEQTR